MPWDNKTQYIDNQQVTTINNKNGKKLGVRLKSCPGCTNALVYNPEKGTLHCPVCGYEEPALEFANDQVTEQDLLERLETISEEDEAPVHITMNCANCGGKVDFDENVCAQPCPFCKTPLVASALSTRLLKPQGMLPFAITQKQALERIQAWWSSRWFMPSNTLRTSWLKNIQGILKPHWTYDFKTSCRYTGERGDDYYETVTRMVRVNGKTQRQTERVRKTRWHSVSGRVNNAFDDLLVPAGVESAQQESLGPWPLADLCDYHEDMVRGFREECYTVGIANGFQNAKEKAKETIHATIRRDIGGDHQRIGTTNISYSELSFKHILLPVWQCLYQYGDKQYSIMLNGKTGAISGNRPYSAWKIFFLVLFIVAVVALLLFFLNAQ